MENGCFVVTELIILLAMELTRVIKRNTGAFCNFIRCLVMLYMLTEIYIIKANILFGRDLFFKDVFCR